MGEINKGGCLEKIKTVRKELWGWGCGEELFLFFLKL